MLLTSELVSSRAPYDDTMDIMKREMTPQGFYGDTFSDGFGGFRTMRKRPSGRRNIEAI